MLEKISAAMIGSVNGQTELSLPSVGEGAPEREAGRRKMASEFENKKGRFS
jgi:hypothetical protein